jgi:hypothetical protein
VQYDAGTRRFQQLIARSQISLYCHRDTAHYQCPQAKRFGMLPCTIFVVGDHDRQVRQGMNPSIQEPRSRGGMSPKMHDLDISLLSQPQEQAWSRLCLTAALLTCTCTEYGPIQY